MHAIIANNIQPIQQLGRKHHLKSLSVFGSVTNGNFTEASDVDFLYEMDYKGFDFGNLENMPFDPDKEFFELKNELEKLLNRKVDLIPGNDFRNRYFQESVNKTKFLIFQNEGSSEIPA
ncbi:MAG: nucleotidyltransferase domain-containing protein [Chitinophagaceae bacterium]